MTAFKSEQRFDLINIGTRGHEAGEGGVKEFTERAED